MAFNSVRTSQVLVRNKPQTQQNPTLGKRAVLSGIWRCCGNSSTHSEQILIGWQMVHCLTNSINTALATLKTLISSAFRQGLTRWRHCRDDIGMRLYCVQDGLICNVSQTHMVHLYTKDLARLQGPLECIAVKFL